MAPSETSSVENNEKDITHVQLTRSTSEERPFLKDTFRSQYRRLHRSHSVNINVNALRCRFETQQEEEVAQVPKPQIPLVDKAELSLGSKVNEEVQEPKEQLVVINEDSKVLDEQKRELVYPENLLLAEERSERLELFLDNPNLVVPEKEVEKLEPEVKEGKPLIVQRRRIPSQLKTTSPAPESKPIKKVLRKSVSADLDSCTSTTRKRVSFSLDNTDKPPVPKPRNLLPIQQVIVEALVIELDKISHVETVRLNESMQSDLDKIEFAEPEPRHHVIRDEHSSLGSVENIKNVLDGFIMDSKKKRNPSFKSKFLTIFSKDKDKKPKEKDENKKTKKTENAVFADNAQNENFNRHSTQRHTIDAPRREPKPMQSIQLQNHQQSFHEEMHPDQKDMEHRYATMHIQNYQQARNTFETSQRQNQQIHQPHQALLRKVSQDHGVYNPNEDYVCMDNKNDAKNYINLPSLPKYDSSSTNTIESENSTTSVNPLQQIQQERMAIRSKFFNETETPPRAQDTNQNVQLVNPKAVIPINSERPLPNPYQQFQSSPQARHESPYCIQPQLQIQDENDLADSGYGTVYDRNSRPISAGSSDISGGSMNSPRSPGVERTKLKLPQNRERMDLQPRLKSPIPPNEVSTDKLIATELLKTNKKSDKKDKDRSSPSHQKLQLEIDYPDLHEAICDVVELASNSGRSSRNQNQLNQNELSITSFHKNDVSSSSFNVTDNNVHINNVSAISNGNMSSISESEVSRETLLEAGDWHRVQRNLASSPSLKNVQITTNALVHVDPQNRANTPSQDGRSRSVTPVTMMRKNSMSSLQRSPPKHEIRQTVEAFCWKELKKLKEQEDLQMQLIVGPMISSCGYAEDPIRRSRSMTATPRDTKRSTSLPREVRPRRVEDMELNARRMAQQQRFNTGPQRNADSQTRPIFNRGSLTQQNAIDQPIYNKKVSFRSQNTQNSSAWPTKNGFTQSPPQRRLDAEGAANGNKERDSLEDDVFLPQASKEQQLPSREEIFLLNQQRQKELLLAKAQRSVAPVTVDGNCLVVDNASVISEVLPMRNIRESIYGTRPPVPTHGTMTNQAMNESRYGTRNTINDPTGHPGLVKEPIYGTRNGGMPRLGENLYGTRNTNPNGYNVQNCVKNETPYDGRQVNESSYGPRHIQNESPYGTTPPPPNRSVNENVYGSRMYPNGVPSREESIYGSKPPLMMQQESVYGSRTSMVREPIYGARPMPPPGMDSTYGTRQNPNGQRFLPGYLPSGHSEAIYRPRGIPPPSNAEGMYGYRMGNGSIRSESPYGSRPSLPMGPNQQHYNRPRLSLSAVGPPLPPGAPGRAGMAPGLRRSNSLRQSENPETLYSGQPNFNKPPSGAQYRQRPNLHPMDLSPPGQKQPEPLQGRYDFPPPDSPPRQGAPMQQEPIYGTRKMNTINNKVCDIYGNIYDANKPGPGAGAGPGQVPMSPPSIQKAGVLYGQLQRNSNAPPMVYQSHQQLQASNFQRGTRLTASVNDMHRYNSNANMGPTPQRTEPPSRPLPPIPDEQQQQQQQQKKTRFGFGRKKNESKEEEWNSDGKRGGLSGSESGGRSDTDGDLRSRSRNNRRDDPRRHTLAGEQYGTMSGQGGPLSRTMDLEGQPRGYPPPSNAMLFDDDPGIMSEVETSSTGFRRGGKQRSSLPVVRTPSKTLERPLGLVFLQYRNETKRALLPNEITSIDTVKALFVRSFPKQLTMEYLDSPQVKIYIHDSSKDMFYELEDLRSHLREIRDRSVLRLFESADVTGGLPMAGIGIAGGAGVPHFEDPSYFSEPEFDSEYQHQHIHKSKGSAKGAPYYIGSTASLPRAGLLRAYSPAVGNLPQDRMKTLPTGAPPKPQRAYSSGTARSGADGAGARGGAAPDRFAQFAQRPNNSLYNIPDGYMSSPERGSRYEETYYSQYGARSGSITPVIDEEISDTELIDDQYSIYGVKIAPGGPRPAPRTQFATPAAPPYDATRIRVEHMERQLANLTGLVQKALTHQTPSTLQVPSAARDSYRDGRDVNMNVNSTSSAMQTPPDDTYVRSETKPPKLGKSGCHKSVSFEKSVSFSDEPPDMNSPKQHSPQHSADTKPTKPAIKSSTLPRTSSQERDRLKPAPPPKPASLSPGQYDGRHIYRDLQLTPEMYNQLRGLQKKAKDLRAEVRNLRRMSQAQAHSVRETIRDTFIKIRAMLMVGGEQVWQAGVDQERVRLSREEDLYKQEMIRLETDLTDLESTVEELRGNVINRKTRVNMSDVENMALVLSKSSKTVADLKLRFPMLQDGLKTMLGTEMEKVVREEKFLKEEPERLESALRRCKKLTGTLVTLKRLASVQEQRLPCSATAADGRLSPTEPAPITPTTAQHSKPAAGQRVGSLGVGGDAANAADGHQRPENALDALLDELQTFSKPHAANTPPAPQVSYPPDSEPPTLPAKGVQPPPHHHPPSMHEIGRKGSVDSATVLPTQTLTVSTATGSLRRLHSYPSGSDTDNSPPIQPIQRAQAGKPPLPERNADLLQHISAKRVPPPPPPRTSSKSPLASPTSPSLPPRSPASNLQHIQNVQNMVEHKPLSQFETATQNLGLGTLRRNAHNRGAPKDASKSQTLPRNIGSNLQVHAVAEMENAAISASNSSSCESVNSQDGTKKRKEELEHRHQELLKKQKALQEQYARLQQLQRGTNTLAVIPPAPDQLLKKTGSESNILQKMGLQLATSQMTGSLTNLPIKSANQQNNNVPPADDTGASSNAGSNATNRVYETDIL